MTLPAEYRRALKLKESDKVAVSLEEGRMSVSPNGGATARTAGLLRGEGPILSAEELRQAAEQAIAEARADRLDAELTSLAPRREEPSPKAGVTHG